MIVYKKRMRVGRVPKHRPKRPQFRRAPMTKGAVRSDNRCRRGYRLAVAQREPGWRPRRRVEANASTTTTVAAGSADDRGNRKIAA